MAGQVGLDRRQLLAGMAGLAAATAGSRLLGPAAWLFAPPAPAAERPSGLAGRVIGFDGRPAWSMGMHLHASFSEGPASYLAHFAEAQRVGLDVLWFTEHDWRMSATAYRTAYHFDGWRELELGAWWKLVPKPSGGLRSGSAAIVEAPVSPLDPSPVAGALRLTADAAAYAEASTRVLVDASSSRWNHRANLAGQRLRLEVLPLSVGPDAWLELRVALSWRPETRRLPAGRPVLSYRFGTQPAGREAQGLLGVVHVPVTPGAWNSVVLRPKLDAAALWPSFVAADNSLNELVFAATSAAPGAVADGVVDWLRLERTQVAADRPLVVQAGILAAYAARFPAITAFAGQEVSFTRAHANQLGGQLHLTDYQATRVHEAELGDLALVADVIHAAGGIGSLNHPFGSDRSDTALLDQATQDAERRALTEQLLKTSAFGLDVIEVGYAGRGGVSLDTHLRLAQSLWRNGVWISANGTTDDHEAQTGRYSTAVNRFATVAYASGVGEAELCDAAQRGRLYATEVSDPGGVGPGLDLALDGAPMGTVSVSPPGSHTLRVLAGALPPGAVVRVRQGVADFAGTAALDPDTTVIGHLGASELADGAAGVRLAMSDGCFLTAEVVDPSGRVVAFTNPVWWFPAPPPVSVPAHRRAASVAA